MDDWKIINFACIYSQNTTLTNSKFDLKVPSRKVWGSQFILSESWTSVENIMTIQVTDSPPNISIGLTSIKACEFGLDSDGNPFWFKASITMIFFQFLTVEERAVAVGATIQPVLAKS